MITVNEAMHLVQVATAAPIRQAEATAVVALLQRQTLRIQAMEADIRGMTAELDDMTAECERHDAGVEEACGCNVFLPIVWVGMLDELAHEVGMSRDALAHEVLQEVFTKLQEPEFKPEERVTLTAVGAMVYPLKAE